MAKYQEDPAWWENVLTPDMSAVNAADRIIADLIGYKHDSSYRKDDAKRLGAALLAFQRRGNSAPLPVRASEGIAEVGRAFEALGHPGKASD